MKPHQQKAYIEKKAKDRARIQSEIQKLNEARNLHVAQIKKTQSSENTLGSAIILAIRQQAQESGLTFLPEPQSTKTDKNKSND
ncbi:MAG: hypothetical protein GY809_06220 [Planctomycetes bacterium]|nr:hypothetical protein [Planctomycetota bacterium]